MVGDYSPPQQEGMQAGGTAPGCSGSRRARLLSQLSRPDTERLEEEKPGPAVTVEVCSSATFQNTTTI